MMKHEERATALDRGKEQRMALSAKEAAIELGTDARTFRKFMRSILDKEEQPGQGNRYQIEENQVKKLKKRFDDWSAPKTTKEVEVADTNGEATKAPPKKRTKKTKEIEAVDIVDAEAMIEPSDAELMELEDALEDLDLDLD